MIIDEYLQELNKKQLDIAHKLASKEFGKSVKKVKVKNKAFVRNWNKFVELPDTKRHGNIVNKLSDLDKKVKGNVVRAKKLKKLKAITKRN